MSAPVDRRRPGSHVLLWGLLAVVAACSATVPDGSTEPVTVSYAGAADVLLRVRDARRPAGTDGRRAL